MSEELYFSVIPYLAALISGFLIAVLSEPLRQWLFKPELDLEFKKEEDFITKTPMHHGEAYYIRVKVTNTKRRVARGCKAYLVNIEKKQQDGEFHRTIYCDTIQLPWSNSRNDAFNGVDLSKGVNQFLDVIKTSPALNIFVPQISPRPYRYESLYREIGVFRFTIQISAENADPKVIELIFTWSGKWDDFEVDKGRIF
jgi:hypothetical protein